jgi:hypothetical protein
MGFGAGQESGDGVHWAGPHFVRIWLARAQHVGNLLPVVVDWAISSEGYEEAAVGRGEVRSC